MRLAWIYHRYTFKICYAFGDLDLISMQGQSLVCRISREQTDELICENVTKLISLDSLA